MSLLVRFPAFSDYTMYTFPKILILIPAERAHIVIVESSFMDFRVDFKCNIKQTHCNPSYSFVLQ